MYIDDFRFSPFKIEKNIIFVWNGEFVIKDNHIYHNNNVISSEEFYYKFLSTAEGTWFVKDFVRFFEDKKSAIPHSLAYFAVYCDCKFTFLSEDI
jgi:hypothetical protein